MAKSLKPKSKGENKHHIVAIRLRVTGSGSLQMRLLTLDDARILDLTSLTMQSINELEPTRLTNFESQRIRFEFKTTVINENFLIGRIIIFAKPVGVGEGPM